jgi:hypothetical protein
MSMVTHLCRGARRLGRSLAVILVTPTICWAHVELDAPNGGETLQVGSTFTIRWYPSIQHDTLNWDLWYSTESSQGGWEAIAMNLPVISPIAGTPHSYDWLVPELGNTDAWIRVRQDNGSVDYYDVSDESFSIAVPFLGSDFNEDGQVGSGDLPKWETGYGIFSGAQHTDGDGDQDGDVDGEDFLLWQRQTTGGGNLAAVQAVPEPVSLVLLALGAVASWRRRR